MADLAGLKVLVVEDEGPVALLIEDMLLDLGCEIAGSAADLDTACQLARAATIDFALLDLNLGGKSAVPVAHILRARGIPFVFSTGYGTSAVAEGFSSHPTLGKPFDLSALREKIQLALAGAESGAKIPNPSG